MPLIVFSKGNAAGETIAKMLIENHNFEENLPIKSEDGKYGWKNWRKGNLQLVEIPTLHIFSDYLANFSHFNDADLLIFASTHRSDTNSPALTVHTCGNFANSNKMGGNPKELAHASSSALKIAWEYLQKNPLENFPAFVEATHHGPTSLKAPVLFAEIGSTEKEYLDEKAGELMVNCIMEVSSNWKKGEKYRQNDRVAIGFGGTHYCAKFSRLMLEENYEFSYVCSKYNLEEVDAGIISQAMEKSIEKVEVALIEKKSMNAQIRNRLVVEISKAGLPHELV